MVGRFHQDVTRPVTSPAEDSPSGLWRSLGKRVGCKPSGVRIPYPPPCLTSTHSGTPSEGPTGLVVHSLNFSLTWGSARRRFPSVPTTAAHPPDALHPGGSDR